MDAIDREMKCQNNLNDILAIWNKTWRDFENATVGKQVFIFGMGAGADFYFDKYARHSEIAGFIDNNPKLQGKKACDYIFFPSIRIDESMIITDISPLIKLSPDKVLVLIASLKHYGEIAEELVDIGITNYFSIFCMEVNYRLTHNIPESIDRKRAFIEYFQKGNLLRNDKIFIQSIYNYGGHLKAIVEELKKQRPSLDVVWVQPENIELDKNANVRIIRQENYFACLHEYVRSKIWLIDGVYSFGDKPQGQICIQTKHWSSITLKSFYYDEAEFRRDEKVKEWLDKETKHMDYILIGSEFDMETCESGFNFHKNFVKVGSPRSDILFRKNKCREKIKKTYPCLNEKKTLLYAPTFRYQPNPEQYTPNAMIFENQLDFEVLKKSLDDSFGGEWFLLVRLHPSLLNRTWHVKLSSYVVDVSEYPDSQELVAGCDALITDYSSIMFEPAFVKKPVFLFTTDREEYLLKDRKFLIDYAELPFPIAESNEELAKNIANFNYDIYVKNIDAFFDKYDVHEDGHASERAARFILDLLDGKVHEGAPRDELDYRIERG